MSKWFRFEAAAVRHPKVTGLSDANKWLWVQLLCLAAENKGQLSHERHISRVLNRRLDHLLSGLDQLIKAGLIDVKDGGYVPHDWEHYQMKSDSSSERMREWRRKRNVSCDVTVTAHDTKRDDKIEAHLDSSPILKERLLPQQLSILPKSAKVDSSAFFEQFWKVWPNKVGKLVAERAFTKAFAKHGLEPIMAGLERYLLEKPADRPWLNPATFLNQERFLDEPAAEPSKTNGSNRQAEALAKLQREIDEALAAEQENGEQDRQAEGSNGIHRSDDEGAPNPSGRSQIAGGGGGGWVWGGRPKGRGEPYHSHAQILDLPDDWRDY